MLELSKPHMLFKCSIFNLLILCENNKHGQKYVCICWLEWEKKPIIKKPVKLSNANTVYKHTDIQRQLKDASDQVTDCNLTQTNNVSIQKICKKTNNSLKQINTYLL